MAIKNSDIRLINGNIETVTEAIKKYLLHANFQIDQEEILQKRAFIKASNLQRSFIKLYLSNRPQIVYWHIAQKNDDQVQIEIKSDLFSRFRYFYYSILSFLLFAFILFLTTTSNFKSINLIQQLPFLSPSYNILISILFLVLAYFFYLRSIIITPYEEFLNNFFNMQAHNGVSNEVVLQSGFGFPDFLKGPLLFALFFIIALVLTKSNTPVDYKQLPHFSFLGGAIIITFALIVLVLIMAYRSSFATRVVFVLIGIGISVPIAIYSNAPVALSYPGNIQQKLERTVGIKKEFFTNNESHKSLQYEKSNSATNFIRKVSLFFASTCALLFLLMGALLICIIQIPVRIVRDLKRFSITQPDSSYYQALHSQKLSYLFNFIIILIWAVICAVNVLGLYFSFSIFEKSCFNMNFIFNSELANLFYDNTQITFIILLQSIFGHFIFLFHRMIMLVYSIPMIMLFVLVLKKNFKSIIEGYSLLKKHPDKHKTIENNFKEIVNDICEFANVSIPIIRVVDSPDITAETKYLGFPFFKNILIISKGVWDELHTVENELNALLAHEIWHIKKHTLTRRFLCFLSDYSLFGNGFLALLQNSFKVEKEADDFAIMWLIKKYQNKNKAVPSLRSLFERIEEVNWRNVILQSSNSFNFVALKEGSHRDEFLNSYNNASRFHRILMNLKLLYHMYFGTVILSYFHPSNSQRISWAKEKYGTNESN